MVRCPETPLRPEHYMKEPIPSDFDHGTLDNIGVLVWRSIGIWRFGFAMATLLWVICFVNAIYHKAMHKDYKEKLFNLETGAKKTEDLFQESEKQTEHEEKEKFLLQLRAIRQEIWEIKQKIQWKPAENHHGIPGLNPLPLPSRPDPGDDLEYKTEPKIDSRISTDPSRMS